MQLERATKFRDISLFKNYIWCAKDERKEEDEKEEKCMVIKSR